MAKLSAKGIEELPPKQSSYIVFDQTAPGFGVRVMPSGVKSYIYRYKTGFDTKQITLGRVGFMTLPDAREHARKLYTEVRTGKDPAAEARARKAMGTTVADLYDLYVENVPMAKSTRKNFDNRFNKYTKPLIGKMAINHPSLPLKVEDIHEGMKDRPAQANLWVSDVRNMLTYAKRRKLISAIPVIDIQRHKQANRGSTLQVEEAAAVWQACTAYADYHRREGSKWWMLGHGFRLLLATGCRKSEILYHLRWDMITDEKIVIPAEFVKTRTALTIYQTDLTREILAQVPRTDPWVFRVNGKHIASGTDNRVWSAIQQIAGVSRHYRIHDIRHTFASLGGNSDTLSLKDVSLLLSHANINTTQRYAHFFDRTKALAAEKMGKHLSTLFSSDQSRDQDDPQSDQ